MTTVEGKAEEQRQKGSEPVAGAKAQPCTRVRARAALARVRSGLTWVWAVAVAWWVRRGALTEAEKLAPNIGRSSLWREAPPSLADMWAHLRAGAFAPGANPWPIEWAGMAYGAVVIAITAVLYGIRFVIGHPARLFGVIALGVLVVVTA